MLEEPNFWNTVSILLNGILAVVLIMFGVWQKRSNDASDSRKRVLEAELKRRDDDHTQQLENADAENARKLEEMRAQNAQQTGLLDLLKGQMGATERLAKALEANTELQRQRGDRETEMHKTVLESHHELITLIKSLPEASKVQHVETRTLVNERSDALKELISDVLNEMRSIHSSTGALTLLGRFEQWETVLRKALSAIPPPEAAQPIQNPS